MKKINFTKLKGLIMSKVRYLNRNGGFGLNEMLGTAVAIIIAAFIIIPGLRSFATIVVGKLNTWWTDIASNIFPTS